MVFFLDTPQHKWECYPQQACTVLCHCLTSRSIGHSPGFIFGTCHHLHSSLPRLRGPGCPRKDLHGLVHSFDIVPRLAKYCENMFPLPAFNVQCSVLIGGSPLLSWTTPIRLVLVSLHIPTNITVRPTSYRSDESYAGQFAPAHFFPRVCSHSMG